MEPLFTTKIIKIKGDNSFETDDILVKEERILIYVNDKRVGALMATPVDTSDLAVGYLISENIINSVDDIERINLLDGGNQINIEAKINQNAISRLSLDSVIISGCGRSVTANFEAENASKIKDGFVANKDEILKQMAKFYTQCPLYEKTGCVHTAKLYESDGGFYIGEDIAQHNTIDKALGKALIAGANLNESFLMVSGRLSSEMVAKAVMHRVPILISRTAPTHLGVKIARKFNLTLCGFARGENMNIYSGGHRIDTKR
ncbi:MAG: formate dehydrogenase accessory sulfurtransferase FdhD [Campylobacter sp.]|nr:formate dehydrogenase accessory sulfurtransferase FdhD [Campylobacter sp.]